MKILLLATAFAAGVANAGSLVNGTWYGIGVPSRMEMAVNTVSTVGHVPPSYQYYGNYQVYTNPNPVAPPVTMDEPIIHSAVMNGKYQGRPQDVFLAECMRYGYNERQCREIWGK